jgi:phosphoribosylamine---glycine ligase
MVQKSGQHIQQHILIIGNGGREHAIAWKLQQSPRVAKISVAPGNGGTPNNVPISATDVDGLVAWAKANQPDLTIIGPEAPLALGIVDAFQAAGLRVFGPTKAAAQLESSKIFAKEFMRRHNIPTASFEVFDDYRQAIGYLLTEGDQTLAIKADGLAAGKGVYITTCSHDAELSVKALMVDKSMGDAGNRIIIERGLEGYELSLLAFCDGRTVAPMLLAQDHKRIFDNDEGPNTGGMGAYTLPYDPIQIANLTTAAMQPVIDGMAAEGNPFVGILFGGFMIGPDGAYVIEYNARFGDPETEVVLPFLETDLLDVFEACVDQRLHEIDLLWREGTAATVVMASGGYPGAYETGKPITGVDKVPNDAIVFHAGTQEKDGQLVTAGGRVLTVTGIGPDLAAALDKAYAGVKAISFEGAHYRTDIGAKALKIKGHGA